MLVQKDLFDKIGFTDKMKSDYKKYHNIIGSKIEPYSKAYMERKLSMEDTCREFRKLASPSLSPHTLDLLFVLQSTGYLFDEYKKIGIDEDIFFDTMKDIVYKIQECERFKGVFGTFVIEWYDGFFKCTRFAFGRLQYDIEENKSKEYKVGDFTIAVGDFTTGCHIPSCGPLTEESCIDSLKKVYAFCKDRLKDGILPVFCHSWLLYPPFQSVFGEGSNIYNFAKNFHIIEVTEQKEFEDAWRIFYKDYNGSTEGFPCNTRMQRAFIEHLNNGGSFGEGNGVMLFDGERII